VIRQAGERGILVVLNPCYRGAGRDGGGARISANGRTKCRQLGQFVDQRCRDFPNIIWQATGWYAVEWYRAADGAAQAAAPVAGGAWRELVSPWKGHDGVVRLVRQP